MNANDSIEKTAKAIWSYRLVLWSFYGFLLFFGAISLTALDSVRMSSFAIWLLQIIPLLPFAPGLHAEHRRSYIWLSLLVLVYFMHGVLVAFDPARLWQGMIQIGFCAALFTSLLVYVNATKG